MKVLCVSSLAIVAITTAMGSSSAEAATIITLGSGFNEPQVWC